jgi:hypothetical protein
MHNGVCTVKLVPVPGPPDSKVSSLYTTPRALLFYPVWGPVPIGSYERNGLGWPCGLAIAGGHLTGYKLDAA